MSIKQKIGNFFIKNSNSYNFYKSQYEKHLKNKKIDASVEEQFHDLNVIPLKRSDRDMDKNGLINFYSKFGFTKYDDDICVTTMIRKAG